MHQQPREFSNQKEISTTSAICPQLSDYMNYREYLAAFYAFKRASTKKSLRPYNYAMFSAAANIKSPNYLKMIIEGKRNLSDDMVVKFAKALGLNKEQAEELNLLVNFTQSMDPADRNLWLKKLSEHRVGTKLKAGEIDRRTWEKVPNWVAWIIYAMVDQQGVVFDVKTLKTLLRGKAAEDEIDTALNTLITSGELKLDATTGELRKGRSLIENPEEVPVALVRKLQAQLMYMGLESLYQDAPTEREFGTLTMSLTKAEFDELKFKLRQMRKTMHKDNTIARMNTKGERVYQLNIQLFPVTDAVGGQVVNVDKKQEIKAALEAELAKHQAIKATIESLAPMKPQAPAANTQPDVSNLVASAASAADLFR